MQSPGYVRHLSELMVPDQESRVQPDASLELPTPREAYAP
jgi:hypothetical protein